MNNILYYTVLSATILLYCIGLNRVELSKSYKDMFLTAVKMYIIVPSTAVFSWIFVAKVLVPLGLETLYPFIAVLLFIAVSVFFEALIRITAGQSAAEYSISFLCVLIATHESCTLLEVLLISLSCVTSYYLILPLIFSLRRHLKFFCIVKDSYSDGLVYISIAVIILAMSAWNISWLNPGVLP